MPDARDRLISGKQTGSTDSQTPHQEVDAGTANALRNEFMFSHQFHKIERSNPSVLDLAGEAGHSAIYSGLQGPAIGLAQLSDKAGITKNLAENVALIPAPEHEEFGTARWHAQVIGGGAGMTLPFLATRGALKSTGLTFAARTEATALAGGKLLSMGNAAVVADGALAGFAYDFLMTPVQKEEGDFWAARRNHGLTGAATFGTLTAGSVALRSLASPLAGELKGAKGLIFDVGSGVTTGVPAGIVNADVNARLTKGRWATGQERVEGAYTMAMAGGVLSAFHKIPGQDISPGDKALKTSSSKTGVANLEAMLEQRARSAAESNTVEASASRATGASPETAMIGGAKRGGSEASRTAAEKPVGKSELKDGRAMAAGDVEGREVKADVKPEQQALLQKAVDMVFEASGPEATPADVAKFINFARTEGADVFDALLKVAEQSGDKQMLALAREAYLPLEGIEHRVIEGDAKIEPEPGKPVTQDQLTRWQQFTEMIADPATDIEGYSKFRKDLFNWLDANPDLHSWVQQFAKQNNWSNVAGPLDFYFQTNEMARFVDVAKDAATPRVEKPSTMADIANMRTFADEFADNALKSPYEETIIENFRALAEKSVGLNVPEFAKILNDALAKKGMGNIQVGVDSNWQMTLYKHRSETRVDNLANVDYSSVPAPEKLPYLGVEDGLASTKSGMLAGESVGIKPDLRSRLEQSLTSDRFSNTKSGETSQLMKDIQHALIHQHPLREGFVDAYKAYTKAMTPENKIALLKEVEQGLYKPEALQKASVAKIVNDFGKSLSVAKEKAQAQYILANTALNLKNQGVALEDVPGELNHVLRSNRMPYEVKIGEDGQLNLNVVKKSEGMAPIISVFYDAKGNADIKTTFEAPKKAEPPAAKAESADRMSIAKFNYGDAGQPAGSALEVSRESRVIAQEFAEDLNAVTKGSEATKITQDTLVKLKSIGVPAEEVPTLLNRALRRVTNRFDVVTTEDGSLELVLHRR